jgi:hypothetical protein
MDQAEQLLSNIEASGNETTGGTAGIPALQGNITVPATVPPVPAKVTPTPATVPAAPVAPVNVPSTSANVTAGPVAPNASAANPPATIKTAPLTVPAVTSNQTEHYGPPAGVTYGQTENQSETRSERRTSRTAADTLKAQNSVDASTANSLTILQDALDKAPDSVKPSLRAIIEHTRATNARFHKQSPDTDTGTNGSDDNTTDRHLPVKPKLIVPQTGAPSDNTSNMHSNNRWISHYGSTSDDSNGDEDDSTDSDNVTAVNPPATNAMSTSSNGPTSATTSTSGSTAVTTPTSGSVTGKQAGTSATVKNFFPFTPNPTRKFDDQTNTYR